MGDRIFKDNAGTPAGYGDTVELIKDKLGNDRLGPELVTNGTFDSDVSGWTTYRCTISSVDGKLVASATGDDPAAYQGISTEVGKSYVVEFDATLFGWTNRSYSYTARAVNTSPYYNEVARVVISQTFLGSYRLQFVATATTTFISFVVAAFSDGVDDFFGFDNVSVRELKGNHAHQTSASLKPVLGRVPVGGRRNMYNASENFLSGSWSTGNCSVSVYNEPAPRGTAHLLTNVGGNGIARSIRPYVRYVLVICKRVDADYIYIGHDNNVYPGGTFDLRTGENVRLSGGSGGYGADPLSVDLGDGWWMFGLGTTGGTIRLNVFWGNTIENPQNRTGNNLSVLIAGIQGTIATEYSPYQRVTSDLDVYEEGEQHIEYFRFDGVDDRLSHTFPDGFEGDLIVCGTKGSWIDEGVSIPAGGELTIGPKNLPNTPNILPALGDIIGWVPVSRTTTEEERQRIIEYYKGRGAGQLLTAEDLT